MGKANTFVLIREEKKNTTKALTLNLRSHNSFDVTFTHTLQALQASLTTTLISFCTNNDSSSMKVLSWFSYLPLPMKGSLYI